MGALHLEGQLVEMLVDIDLDVVCGMCEVVSGGQRDTDVELRLGVCQLQE